MMPMSTTPTFITEPLHFVACIQLFKKNAEVNLMLYSYMQW